MSALNERQHADKPGTVLHWRDCICPFCYIGQKRNGILARQGLHVIEFAFQAHPEIPAGGTHAGINIVHINTELRVAWRHGLEDGFLAKQPNEVAPYKILPFAVESVKQIVRSRPRLFNDEK